MIFHITSKEDWKNAQAKGEYTAPSLALEGFIHCSTLGQTVDTANIYYKGISDLILLCIDEGRLMSECKYENPTGTARHNPTVGHLFPHIYGPLNLDSVVEVVEFPLNENGFFDLPQEASDMASHSD